MKIFIISSVRDASPEYRIFLNSYVKTLEEELGHTVHLPHRDTDQTASGLCICKENMQAIQNADEIHLFYTKESQGSHFDLGMAFMLNKKLKVIENEKIGAGKSLARMVKEWENSC